MSDVEFLRAAAPRLRAQAARRFGQLALGGVRMVVSVSEQTTLEVVERDKVLADLIDGILGDYDSECAKFKANQITGAGMAMPVWQGMFKRLATYTRSALGETP